MGEVPLNVKMSFSLELLKIVRDEIKKGSIPILTDISQGKHESKIVFISEGPDKKKIRVRVPAIKEERCVLIVDLVGFSQKTMEEQLLLVETMNKVFKDSEETLLNRNKEIERRKKMNGHMWDLYKGTGDGAIFIFGNLVDPTSVRDAIAYATWTMSRFIHHNIKLPADALNSLKARMALSYGKIFQTIDLQSNIDILGDAINVCARLASSNLAAENCILIDETIYHNLMLNHSLYFANSDKTIPKNGIISDFVIGKQPDGNNMLYLEDEGYHETKDRRLKVFNI